MKREEMSIKNTIIGLFICLCALIVIFASAQVKAVVNPTADSITLDVQCANGRMGKGKCPAGQEQTVLNKPRITNFNTVLESAFQGVFGMGTYEAAPHPEVATVTSYSAAIYSGTFTSTAGAIAFNPNNTSFYFSGQPGAWNGEGGFTGSNAGQADSIAEFSIPTLRKNADLNDRTGIIEATMLQPWSAAFKTANGLIAADAGFHSINGLHYDTANNQLCVSGLIEFDTDPYTTDNLLCYANPSNLAGSTIKGYYQARVGTEIDKAAHAATWMAAIPSAWQSYLGGSTLFGGGQNASILDRLPAGVTLFSGSLNNLPSNGNLPLNRLLDYDNAAGKQMGSHLYGSPTDWYNYEFMNCNRAAGYDCGQSITDSTQVVAWINDWFNILSYGAQGFIIPNTRTYVVIGTMQGAEDGISYKGWPAWMGSRCSGPCRVTQTDEHNKYWLFDLTEILNATDPSHVMPYEHGYITMFDALVDKDGNRAKLLNAGFDLYNGKLGVVFNNRYGTSIPHSDVFVFSSESWKEQ